MYFQAQAVSRAVAIYRQTASANHLSGGSINFGDFDPGFYHFYSSSLGFLHGIVNFFIKDRRPANGETAWRLKIRNNRR